MTSLCALLASTPDPRPVDPGALSTGFFDLDCAVGGWHPGDLILIAEGAEHHGLGRLLAAHCVLTAAIKDRASAAIVSLVTSEMRWSQALLAVHAGQHRVGVREHRAGSSRLQRASEHLCRLALTLCSLTAADLEELEETVLRLQVGHRLVVVHGLTQLAGRQRASPAHILSRLQRLARCLTLPIVCLVPREYFEVVDADVCLRIDESAIDNQPASAEVNVVRNRHGELGWVHLEWDPSTETLGPLDPATKDYGGQHFQIPDA